MSIYESKERWLEIEIKNIEKLLNYLIEEDSKSMEPWFFSPQNLENAVGKENINFIRALWQNSTFLGKISFNILVIIYKHLFFTWTEEAFQNKVYNLLKNLLKQYADWWEKPIIRKLFDKKENSIKAYGKDTAGQIIGSLCINQYKYDSNKHIISTKNLPRDGEIISYYKLVDKIREYFPGYLDLIRWREKYPKWVKSINNSYCCSFFCLFLVFIFVLSEWLLVLEFFFLSFLFINAYFIMKEVENIWCRIFNLNLVLIYLNYLYFNILILPDIKSTQEYLLWYSFQLIFWIILIISFSVFKYQTRYLGKSKSFLGVIIFYFISFWYMIWLIFFYFDNNVQSFEIEVLFLMLIILFFYLNIYSSKEENSFKPEIWARMRLIKPLKIYESLGILNDFALVFADASNRDIKEVLDGLELSRSIDYNCKKFDIKFKINIDHTFEIISMQKDEIFNIIIPNCPEDKECPVLVNKLEDFNQQISENIKIQRVDLSSINLKVYEKLPDSIKIALERAERYFKILRLYQEDSYGMCVLELAKSLEDLLKILFNEFISNKGVINCLRTISGDSRIQKELPIVSMIKNGVKLYTFGSFLYIIQETFSYPKECKIRQELINFLKNNLPVDPTLIIKLRELTNYRNDYAHIPGEIITPEQYLVFRDHVFQIINLLRVNLSDMMTISISTPRINMTKIA